MITYKDGKHYTGNLIIDDHKNYTKITNKHTKNKISPPGRDDRSNIFIG